MATVSSLVIARFMRLAHRSSDTWQGGLVRMPAWMGELDEEPRRVWGAVWLSLETDLVNVKLAEGEADWRLALEVLTELGLRFAGTRPACLEVADPAVADEIVRALGDRDLAVKVSADIPLVKDRVRQMAEYTHGGPLPPDAPCLTLMAWAPRRGRHHRGPARRALASNPGRRSLARGAGADVQVRQAPPTVAATGRAAGFPTVRLALGNVRQIRLARSDVFLSRHGEPVR